MSTRISSDFKDVSKVLQAEVEIERSQGHSGKQFQKVDLAEITHALSN